MKIDPAQLFGRGVGFPLQVGGDGHVRWSEGEEDVRQSIRLTLETAQGERLGSREFGGGLRDLLHLPNTLTTHARIEERIRAALTRWEPRVRVSSVEVHEDPEEPSSAIATITYRLVATQTPGSLSVVVRLQG
ncbi:MAG: GPW/gp25 family protein [Deltaproteobacteria bacterium]|nr:GPW/gp25 family protein [Deltaproteobacteria bacterium]